MEKMAIYNRLPVWGQNLACYYEGSRIKRTRYGKDFWRFLAEYESRADWSYEQLCDYRDARLRKMIHHCYDTVPYYTKLFNDGGIKPDSIKTLDDLKVLPVLTKDDVKANIENLISTAVPKKEIKIHQTGGTTGAGLNFHTTDSEEAEQWAVWWRYRRMHDISFDTWCGNFGGKIVVPISAEKPPYWRKNIPGKQVFFSGYHINEVNAPFYADSIKRQELQWIHGYPSNIANLAYFMIQADITVPLKWISIGAENLYEYQKQHIRDAFCAEPIQHYGLTEGVANVSQNTDGKLVVDEDFCCIRFLDAQEQDTYRIVGTTLSNYTMPLLQYDTGDLAQINTPGQHTRSGRTVDFLNGRSNEYVVLPNGVKVGAAAISLILNRFQDIQETQIVQKSNGPLLVQIAKRGNGAKFDSQRLMLALSERFGSEIDIRIEFVDAIPKTKSGKLRLVVSELSR